MACKDEVYSNDYYDFIAEYGVVYGVPDLGECQQEISERYKIAYIKRALNNELTVTQYGTISIPNCFGLLDTSALEASGISQMQNQPVLSLRGEGVLMGMLDSGIDYQNPLFRFSDGTSRIEAIWDQEIQDGTPPEGFIYGHEYSHEVINDALSAENPLDIVPSTDDGIIIGLKLYWERIEWGKALENGSE